VELSGPMRWWRREVIMYFLYTSRKPDLMLCTCFCVNEPWLCHYFYFIWLLSTILFCIRKQTGCILCWCKSYSYHCYIYITCLWCYFNFFWIDPVVLLFSIAFLCYSGILYKIVLKSIFLKCNNCLTLLQICTLFCWHMLISHLFVMHFPIIKGWYEVMIKFGMNYVHRL
jgi:hypothetical protein